MPICRAHTVILGLFVSGLFVSCSTAPPPKTITLDDGTTINLPPLVEAPDSPPDLETGEQVYRVTCAPCHGYEGHGDGPAAAHLDFVPRALSVAQYRFRSTASGELATADDLLRTVTDGLNGAPMPAYRDTLTIHQRRSVVAYIQSISPFYAEESEPAEPLVDWEMEELPEVDIMGGHDAYKKAGCDQCHGETGAGDGPANFSLYNDQGQHNPAHDLTLGYLKRGIDRKELYTSLLTGLDGTAMPSYQGSLTKKEMWALTDYVMTLIGERGFWNWLSSRPDRDY